MLDCLSNGRMISGFARGIPREYQVHNVPLAESRARFEEAYEIITRAWTEEVFSYQGKFWSYKDVAIWPRPVQQPHPPIWMPIIGSKESIEFAGRHNIPITPGLAPRRAARRHHPLLRQVPGRGTATASRPTICRSASAYVADSKAQAVKEVAALSPLLQPHAVQPRQLHRDRRCSAQAGYVSRRSTDYVRPENLRGRCPAARGFPQHDDGRRRAAGRAPAVGHAAAR